MQDPLNMSIRLLLLACFVLSAQGCHASGGREHITQDSSADTPTSDPRTDDAAAPDTPADTALDRVPDGWHFIDRDEPDRNVPVNLLFAALPDIAFSGSSVGLVYHGMQSGADEAVGFVPLGSRGEVVGEETILLSGAGLTSSIPRIAHSGDGNFLVTLLRESGDDRIVIQRVSPTGEVLTEGSTGAFSSGTNPLSPPLRIGDHAFVASTSAMPGGEGPVIYRFEYPDLEFDHIGMFAPFLDCSGADPIIAKDPASDQILLFHRCNSMENVAVDWLDTNLNPTGATTVFGHTPVTAFHASSSSSGWFGYGFEQRLDVTSVQFWEFNPAEEIWLAPDIEAHLYGPLMDSDHSDHAGFRTTGATFAVYYDDIWEIWARLSAHPPHPADYGLTGDLMLVSDRVEARALEDVPMPTLAWTDGGFLVVWDQWREDSTYSLFSSFIEIEYVY